jgi:ankyrin repeat protein
VRRHVAASEHGHHGTVQALLARGARQELQNSNGRAALHCAASNGHVGVVELLCAAPGAATIPITRRSAKEGALS